MRPFDRAIILVLDSLGVGALPDAADYGDEGVHTLDHIIGAAGLDVPCLASLGLARVSSLPAPAAGYRGASGRMAERSSGKDTTTGHWELAGLLVERPFRTYPDGFPEEVVRAFEEAIGRKVLYNKPASGTEIIARLGEEHQRTGFPILYTSADSVFQLAAHEETVPLETLYDWCRTARAMLRGEHEVGRVIARPFLGGPGGYARTPNRHDFGVDPSGMTLLDRMKGAGLAVIAVGKIEDIFNARGVTRAVRGKSNPELVERTMALVREETGPGLVFTNLVDFDMKFGHRRDVAGYRAALEDLDRRLPVLLEAMGERDALFLCADHGCDPTHTGTDHTREYVPVLVAGERIAPVDLGVRGSFADLGQTVAENFGLRLDLGESFLDAIRR